MPAAALAACRLHLLQGVDLLQRLDDAQYASRRGEWSPVGAQYRHVVEHFKCLIAGAAAGRVDYDARPREVALEVSRAHARETTLEIAATLDTLASLPLGHPIEIQLRSHEESAEPEWTRSTLGRELQFLVSHTVHHFALIKLLLGPSGPPLPPELGTAAATLAHAKRGA